MNTAYNLLAGAAAALSLASCQKVDDDAFGKRVHAYLMAHPEVIREAVVKLNENERQAASKSVSALVQKNRDRLERDPRDAVINPQGRITLVEFFDYRCGYCKSAAPEVVALVQENPDIRLVLKEFPIFGEVSDTAARIALTDPAKAKSLTLYQSMMADKALDEAAVDRHLTEAGLNPAELRKSAQAPAIGQQIADTRKLASDLRIQGTPAFIIGDSLIPGADMGALRAAIVSAKATGLKRP